MTTTAAHEFESHRRFLWALAYRMTGSAADADDIVQETFVRALEHPPREREDGWRAWLTRVATNLAIDALRKRKREAYIGPWLPSPVEHADDTAVPAHEITSGEESTEYRYDLMESVSMAFLVALERLTPRQRAVLLLRDVFDYSVDETAQALSLSGANVKVTLHRARRLMASYRESRPPRAVKHDEMEARLREFLTHLQNHDVQRVEAMLADDVRFVSDGAGEYAAAMQPIEGRDRVLRLMLGLAAKPADYTRIDVVTLNGAPAFVAEALPRPRLAPRFVMQVQLAPDGRIREIHVVLAPRKLTHVRWAGAEPLGPEPKAEL